MLPTERNSKQMLAMNKGAQLDIVYAVRSIIWTLFDTHEEDGRGAAFALWVIQLP